MQADIVGVALGGVPGRKAAARGPLASLRRGGVPSGEGNAVQPRATLRTLCNLDPQQDQQPLAGGLRRLFAHRRPAKAQQSPALRQSLAFDAVGQQAVVADAKEAVGQDMLEKAVEKLVGRQLIRIPEFRGHNTSIGKMARFVARHRKLPK